MHALDDVNLTVEAGSMVAVMGPSGSGKSTLLTIAGSLEEPTSGEVYINGVSLATMSRNARAQLRRRQIGFVFQDFNLLPGLTAAENVALPLELDGTSARKARIAGLKALEELGLGDRAGSFPDQLSGGERQRVAIARAVVGDRRLLLADEPSGALDSTNGEAVMRLIHAACKRGVAAVVVTHDAQLASWADRVVFLRDGRVDRPDPPAAGPESLLASGRSNEHRPGRAALARGGDRQRGRSRPARGDPLGLAAVPPRVAPAAAGPGPHRGGGGRHRRRRGGGHQHPAHRQRRVRHRPRPGHVPGTRRQVGRRHRRHPGTVRPG